jgi:hypothetical protein
MMARESWWAHFPEEFAKRKCETFDGWFKRDVREKFKMSADSLADAVMKCVRSCVNTHVRQKTGLDPSRFPLKNGQKQWPQAYVDAQKEFARRLQLGCRSRRDKKSFVSFFGDQVAVAFLKPADCALIAAALTDGRWEDVRTFTQLALTTF